MNPDDKIDLSSVNRTKKQFKLPKLKNPFKHNSASPGRDQFGQFASGTGGLNATKHFNWKRAAPLVIVVALIGGFFVFKSFAGTRDRYFNCAPEYTQACFNDTYDAGLIRMYGGVLGRAADKSGLQYWVGQFQKSSNPASYTTVAQQFINSSEFQRKYGNLSDAKFVEAMYPQILRRVGDKPGMDYWTRKLTSKAVTRAQLVVNLVNSSEAKNKYAEDAILQINTLFGSGSYPAVAFTSKAIKTFTADQIGCAGTVLYDKDYAKNVCRVASKTDVDGVSEKLFSIPVGTIKPGKYQYCADVKISKDINTKDSSVFFYPKLVQANSNIDSNGINASSGWSVYYGNTNMVKVCSGYGNYYTKDLLDQNILQLTSNFTLYTVGDITIYEKSYVGPQTLVPAIQGDKSGYKSTINPNNFSPYTQSDGYAQAYGEYLLCGKGTTCDYSTQLNLTKGTHRLNLSWLSQDAGIAGVANSASISGKIQVDAIDTKTGTKLSKDISVQRPYPEWNIYDTFSQPYSVNVSDPGNFPTVYTYAQFTVPSSGSILLQARFVNNQESRPVYLHGAYVE